MLSFILDYEKIEVMFGKFGFSLPSPFFLFSSTISNKRTGKERPKHHQGISQVKF